MVFFCRIFAQIHVWFNHLILALGLLGKQIPLPSMMVEMIIFGVMLGCAEKWQDPSAEPKD